MSAGRRLEAAIVGPARTPGRVERIGLRSLAQDVDPLHRSVYEQRKNVAYLATVALWVVPAIAFFAGARWGNEKAAIAGLAIAGFVVFLLSRMVLVRVKCPNCEQSIGTKAEVCPHCDARLRRS